jgi:uncharacterized surface protein with fasciclin (FAS1) repeats
MFCIRSPEHDVCLAHFLSTVALLSKAGLVDAVSNTPNITLIAPTNAAFDRLPAGVVNFLQSGTSDANSTLTAILTYHVILSLVLASDLRDRTLAATLQGEQLNVFVEVGTGSAYFNYAQVTQADIRATNGYIHASTPSCCHQL